MYFKSIFAKTTVVMSGNWQTLAQRSLTDKISDFRPPTEYFSRDIIYNALCGLVIYQLQILNFLLGKG